MICRRLFVAAAALAGLVSAQVHTDCNPMEKDDCPRNPAFGSEYNWNFNTTPNGNLWTEVVGGIEYDEKDGAAFTIKKQGDSPTLRTQFYFFFGRTEIWMKAAPGQGIVSSMMWLSDDLDEVDWEFLGTNETHANTNWFGKGIQNFTNGGSFPMSDIHTEYHNYTIDWTKEKLDWYIDGNHVRELLATDANNTETYPQTPMRMSLGIWAGGDPSLPEGTREWAGGTTDYDNGPYTMYVKSAMVTDYSSGKEYYYGDRSGNMDSIKIVDGNSTAVDTINQVPEKSLNDKFNDLPNTAKIAIYAGGAAVGALLLGGLIFYCFKQRRRGAREAKLAEQRSENERLEMARFKKEGIDPDSFREQGQEYNARDMQHDGTSTPVGYNVPSSPPRAVNEKSWDSAAVGGAMASGAVGSMRSEEHASRVASPAPSTFSNPRSPQQGHFSPLPGPMRTPSPGMARSQSPMIRSQSPGMPPQHGLPPAPMNRMASPVSRMQSPGSPGPQRMGSPAMNGPPRSYSGNQQAYGARRMQPASPMSPSSQNYSTPQEYQGVSQDDYWNGSSYRQ